MGRSYALRVKLEPLTHPKTRSKHTNLADGLPRIDGRSPMARRFRDLVSQIVTDSGGADRLSEVRLQLVRRFSAACVLAEQMEARVINGVEIDVGQHALLTSSLVRIAQRIGINRVPKELPSLADYVRQREVELAEEEAESDQEEADEPSCPAE